MKYLILLLAIFITGLHPLQAEQALKIAPPPNGGMYIGQYEWLPGHVDTFETTIGRPTAWFSRYGALEYIDGHPHFSPADAERAWAEGKILLVAAYEAIPIPDEPALPPGFTVDKLLRGEYDEHLRILADSLRIFGKPMFFHTAREPLGIGASYMGGFGADGAQSLLWALESGKGFAEFDPSTYPHAQLYADLGDPEVSDGVERLVAAQRYYHHFFVELADLHFLTFDTMGWTGKDAEDLNNAVEEWLVDFPGLDPQHVHRLLESSYDFANFYPGDDYVDWISTNFYTLDFYAEDWTGLEEDFLVPTSLWLGKLEHNLNSIAAVAPDKPIFFLEFGLPDGRKQDSAYAASKVDDVFRYLIEHHPKVQGFSMWSWHPFWMIADFFPYDCLIRPGTAQGDKLREIIDANADYFHSCVYFSDGTLMPTCAPVSTAIATGEMGTPHSFFLAQNAPNPFNPSTSIHYQLTESRPVRLIVYDLLGQPVRTLVDGLRTRGAHTATWDGRDQQGKAVASGVYLYRLHAGRRASSGKMLLLR